jgi:hypothetical protein
MNQAAQWSPAYAAASQWVAQQQSHGMRTSNPTATIGEQQNAPFRARLYTAANAVVLEADVRQVLVRVYNSSGQEVYGATRDPADVIVPLQVTPEWVSGGEGYNLAVTIPGRGVFLAGGGDYLAEFVLEMNDGDTISVRGRIKVAPLLTFQETQTQ